MSEAMRIAARSGKIAYSGGPYFCAIKKMKEVKLMSNENRAWIYSRVDTQNKTDSVLEMQESELRRYAQQQGYTVVGASADAASGTKLNRSGLSQMLEVAQHGTFDVLFVVSFSRLWRDAEQLAVYLCQFQALGLDVYSAKEGSAKEHDFFSIHDKPHDMTMV